MRVWTYGEQLDKVQNDFDLVNETFITPDEYVGLWNDAIQTAAAEIQKLGVEDEYFTTSSSLALVTGQALYSMPTNIYAAKIRSIIYANGVDIYEIMRLRRQKKHLYKAELNYNASSYDYQYDLRNADIDTGFQIELVPKSRETSSANVTVNYVREAKYIPLVSVGSLAASRATKVDIPEFSTFIFADAKYRVAQKIPHPNLGEFKSSRDEELARMITTLTEMVADDATTVVPDMSHYQESS